MFVGRWLSMFAITLAGTACGSARVTTPAAPAKVVAEGDDGTFCLARAHGSLGKHRPDDALASLDDAFLKAHAFARAAECRRLETERLVIRFSFGQVEARARGVDLLGGKVDVLPPEYHSVKSASHAVFLAALLFEDRSPEVRAHAAESIAAVDAALAMLEDRAGEPVARIPAELLPVQRRILRETSKAMSSFARGELDAAAQAAYFERMRPDVHRNLRAVSGALVRGLDQTVKRARAAAEKLDRDAWDQLLVIVTVSHQSRAREIGVQYFERLLNERPGEGARNERRLVVSEGLGKPSQQYGLLGAHIVDQVGSARVFDDPLRLQWDVLADDGGVLDGIFPR